MAQLLQDGIGYKLQAEFLSAPHSHPPVGSQIMFLCKVMVSAEKATPTVQACVKHWPGSGPLVQWPKQDTDSSPASVEWENNILPVTGGRARECFLSNDSND